MLPNAVTQAFLVCMATGPDMSGLDSSFSTAGFKQAGKEGADVKWRHSAGFEAFRSELPDRRVCSVWFDQEYADAIKNFERFARKQKITLNPPASDNFGQFWPLTNGRSVRVVTQEGNSRRVGIALFVPKG